MLLETSHGEGEYDLYSIGLKGYLSFARDAGFVSASCPAAYLELIFKTVDYDDGAAMISLRQRYLIALYWASGTSTGLGTGITPANEYEYAFVSCAHVLGVVIMGSVIGWIARAIESSQSPIEKMIEQKLDVIKDITRWRGMPPELSDQPRSLEHVSALWQVVGHNVCTQACERERSAGAKPSFASVSS